MITTYDLRMHVGAVELHAPVVDVPSPSHVTSTVLDKAKPLLHVNEHELPCILVLVHVGEFPLLGAMVVKAAGHVISENQ